MSYYYTAYTMKAVSVKAHGCKALARLRAVHALNERGCITARLGQHWEAAYYLFALRPPVIGYTLQRGHAVN